MGVRASSPPSVSMSSVATQQRAVPTSGQTVTATQTNAAVLSVVLEPAAALLSLSLVCPTGGFDGQRVFIMSTQAITTYTLTSATGSVVGAPASMAALGFMSFVWNTAQTTWYRIG